MISTQQQIHSDTTVATVSVVDGDQSVLDGIRTLLGTLNVRVRCYRSAEQFFNEANFNTPGCVVAEVHLPGINGIDLLKALRSRGVDYPVVMLASDADVGMAVTAMHLGAVDFIEKPFVDRVLIGRVRQALRTAS